MSDYTAIQVSAARAALQGFESATAANVAAKGAFLASVVTLGVALIAADNAFTGKTASTAIGQLIATDGTAKATLGAYRSAISWRMDSATIAVIRANCGNPAAVTPQEFAALVDKEVARLGDVWADYKKAKKAEKEAKDAQSLATEKAVAEGPAPVEGDLRDDNAPEADPVMSVLTDIGALIQWLRENDQFDALELVAAQAVDAMAQLSAPAEDVAAAA